MMKMMILAPRRAGMTHEEFRRYVTEVHGPLVRSVPEVASAIRHYHYNFPVPATHDSLFQHPPASHLDIVTQGWFDSREAQLENMAQPRYLALVRPDEGRFADAARAVMHYTQERVIHDGPAGLRRLFYFRRRRAGISREQMQAAWHARFGRRLAALTGFEHVVSRYVQNHVMPESDHPDGTHEKYFDLIDEIHLRDGLDIGQLAGNLRELADLRAVESQWLDVQRTRHLHTETVLNIP